MPRGGFGSPLTPRTWPGWAGAKGRRHPVQVPVARPFSTNAVVGTLLSLLVVLFGVALAISSASSSSKATPKGTLATLPTTTGAGGAGTPASAWPVEARPLAQAASTAAQIVKGAAGSGWSVAAVTSMAEAGTGGAAARPTWLVDMVGPPSPTAPDAVQWRTYKVDGSGTVSLLQDTMRPAAGAGSAPLGALWPVALEQAVGRLLTPARQRGLILVRYGCDATAPDTSGCGWELRFLESSTHPVEVDRAYVTADGQKVMAAPSWASAP